MKTKIIFTQIKQSNYYHFFKKHIWNRYTIVVVLFLIWMTFFDVSNFFVQNELNQQINKLELQKNYFKTEYLKNDTFYKTLNNNKLEREKYARENYFMKKENEDIFILVIDSSKKK